MIKRVFIAILGVTLMTSCVSAKLHKELQSKYANLKKEHKDLLSENKDLLKAKNELKNKLASLQKEYDEAVAKRDQLQSDYTTTKSTLDKLKKSYSALETNSEEALANLLKENRELLAKLETKEQVLAAENKRLKALEKTLAERSKRVEELENVIAAKDAAMTKLKDAISKALTDFEGKGLTIEQRDGKIYVSMENKLLFNPGSWAVGAEGRKAVQQLGNVLGQNPDIAILIEGHTDNDPYNGSEQIKGNWDLSTKRATAIVNILQENEDITPSNLTAAGRGEHAPIATNDSAEGKAKNRRIEVVLEPKLDEISKLLNEI